jgi:transmembrane sensor
MSPGNSNPSPDPQLAAEAGLWLARHDRGLTGVETESFLAWRARSPAHAEEFDRLSNSWRATELLRADSELAQRASQLEAATRARPGRRTHLIWATSLAAAAAAVALAVLKPWPPAAPAENTVAIAAAASVDVQPSTARRLELPDGSVAYVRGESVLEPAFDVRERRVRLVRGEAHFMVRKDAARPFVVESQGVAVRAIGTAFNVAQSANALEILVTEGVVALSTAAATDIAPLPSEARQARAFERATVAVVDGQPALPAVAVTGVSAADIDRALAWQVARLTFRNATLAAAIAAFNTHGAAQIELADPALAARQVSGTFRADRAAAFVRLLEQASEVRVERMGDGRVRLHPAE